MQIVVESFENEFRGLHQRLQVLLQRCPEASLFLGSPSAGENLIRSAAEIEMIFGGITTRLWDDPFEWTLPEELADKESIGEYFEQVAKTCDRGLEMLASDEDLARLIPAPEELTPISEILHRGIRRSTFHLEVAEDLLRSEPGGRS